MAFRLVDGKIMKVDGKFSFRKVNSLTFEVDDIAFPNQNSGAQAGFGVSSSKPIKISVVSNSEVFNFESTYTNGSKFFLSLSSDGNTINGLNNGATSGYFQSVVFSNPVGGTNTTTIYFENIDSIRDIVFNNFNLIGTFPKDINSLISLETLQILGVKMITDFPSDLSRLTNLSSVFLNFISASKLPKIPDSLFDLPLTVFRALGVFDLSDFINSNAFKINQFLNLRVLELSSTNLNSFPLDWTVFKNTLQDIRLLDNGYTEFPQVLEEFSNLRYLHLSLVGSNGKEWFNMSEMKELRYIIFSNNIRVDNISTVWNNLFSLLAIAQFNGFIASNTRFNEFINQFYTLCTTNGSITNNSGQFATYPNRFRNISWGHASLSFTGAKVAPTGYVQGVSNGTPANEGEKVYVLQNQYGHVITHA